MELTDHTRFLVIRVTSVIAAQRLEDLILGYIEDQQVQCLLIITHIARQLAHSSYGHRMGHVKC